MQLCVTALQLSLCFCIINSQSVPSSLNCHWECLEDDTSSCLCVVPAYTTWPTWQASKQICEGGGAQFARIDTTDLLNLLEKLVITYQPNKGYTGTGPFDTSALQVVAIGLQRNGCRGFNTSKYMWTDNCLQGSFLQTDLPQMFPNYNNSFYNWNPHLPLSAAMSADPCDDSSFYYDHSPGLGPFDDLGCPTCNSAYPWIAGTACRYDLEPCGSSPCNINTTCQAVQSCFKCVPNCQFPPLISNGSIIGDGFTLVPQQTVFVGSSVLYSCLAGFYLVGSSRLTCTNGATWDNVVPTCKPLCPTPTISNGVAQLSASLATPSTTATFSCNANYNLTVVQVLTCMDNGTWSDSYPACIRIEYAVLTTTTTPAFVFEKSYFSWWWFFGGFAAVTLILALVVMLCQHWLSKRKQSRNAEKPVRH